MFKKKNELPPRPKPPMGEQMLEDLKVVLPEDPVFLESSSNYVEDHRDLNESFKTIKSYVEDSKSLQILMTELQEKNKSLHISNVELQNMAKDIRNQVLNALK